MKRKYDWRQINVRPKAHRLLKAHTRKNNLRLGEFVSDLIVRAIGKRAK